MNSWGSFVVAIVIIFLFYIARRYTLEQNNPSLKKELRLKEEAKPLEMIMNKKVVKQTPTKGSPSPSASAHLIMHPHSFERAKNEYLQYAPKFSGLYEMLYLSSAGKLTSQNQQQLLKNWEEGIMDTGAQNFILAWNTIIQKYCGRNLYFFKGNPKQNSSQNEEERILQDWLKTLHKWGLHREPRAQIQSELQGGEALETQEINYYWVLNGEVLEEGRDKSSLGQ